MMTRSTGDKLTKEGIFYLLDRSKELVSTSVEIRLSAAETRYLAAEMRRCAAETRNIRIDLSLNRLG